MSFFTQEILAMALPELFLALSAMFFLIFGVFRGNEVTRFISGAAIMSFAVAGLFLYGLDWKTGHSVMNGMFILDPFSMFLKLLIMGGLAASLALSIRYLQQEKIERFEYPVLVMFAGIGMMLMVSSNHLLSLYVGLELQSLSLYVLAAFHRDHIKSSEAGIKYFILGALASGMLLFGISLVYGFAGHLGYEEMAAIISQQDTGVSAGLIVGMVFVLVGIAFKISAVPFHMWTPDVYEGSPVSVTALFAIVPKVAAIGLLMRLLFGPFGDLVVEWQQVLWFMAAASTIVGAFAALAQDNIKRLLAYSSIGNMGYALIGVVAATTDGVSAVLVYMTIYMIMTAGTFGVVMMMRRQGMAVESIGDLSGLSRNNPMAAYALAILMFSMSGIPPMAGFFGKLFIFEAAVAQGLYVLAVIGVLTSVVAAFYYLRVIKVMFFDAPADPYDKDADLARNVVVAASVLFVVLFIFKPSFLLHTTAAAASSLVMMGS